MNRNKILAFASLTLVFFPLVGVIIIYFFLERDYSIMFRSELSIGWQLLFGTGVGIVAGLIAWLISETKWVKPKSSKYLHLIGEMNLREMDIIIISICAGVGEELLFRGALQPLMGVWLTAFLFVLIHGYIDPRDWRISIYGLSMTIIIAFLGYMADAIGIWSAAVAHAMIDYVLLQFMVREWKKRKKELLRFSADHLMGGEEE